MIDYCADSQCSHDVLASGDTVVICTENLINCSKNKVIKQALSRAKKM